MGLKDNDITDELAPKGKEMPLYGPEPCCVTGNELMAMTLKNEKDG